MGIRNVVKGIFDLGGSCRHKLNVPEEEGVKFHHVAWDALVIITNKDNPVNNITVDQIKAVFNGDIRNWKELGGPDKPIGFFCKKRKNKWSRPYAERDSIQQP